MTTEKAIVLDFLGDVEVYVDFMVEHQITADEFLFCYLLYLDKIHRSENGRLHRRDTAYTPIALMYKYIGGVKKWGINEIRRLVEKNLLVDNNATGTTDPDMMEVTDRFVDAICSTYKDFDEFWDAYPGFTANFKDRKGPDIPLKAVDYDEVEQLYMRRIKNKREHKKMMEVLNWARGKGKVTVNIKNWLSIWKDVREKMLQERDLMTENVGQREA